jgi:putative molybdopterin biosynthesis protein
MHLLDPVTASTTAPSCPRGPPAPGLRPDAGDRLPAGDGRFEGLAIAEAVRRALDDPGCVLVNRNRGSGTRLLIDELLAGRRPPGFAVEARSHNAVAAAVAQGRADWGLAIAPVAASYGLGFLPVREERYDFAIPLDRWDRPAVAAFRGLLDDPDVRKRLVELGMKNFTTEDTENTVRKELDK